VASRPDTLERIHVESAAQLHDWLMEHQSTSSGVWVVTWRRPTGKPRPEYGETVDELVSFGWIDGKLMKLDESRSMLLCAPRNPKSEWAKSNRERAARLVREGRMEPRGLEAVRRAKENGTWDSLVEVENMVEPAELAAALDAHPIARRNWDASSPSYKQQMLYQLHTAKRPDTRERRITRILAMLTTPA
jgi:uncharacterized protein YdeI (YjbR/CyaY-like superfamily)